MKTLLLVVPLTMASMISLRTQESDPNANPTGFYEGLPAYVRPKVAGTGEETLQLLLCSSGTVSYTFTDNLPAVTPE